jgi:ArsR family transcriptional regulator, arsenate/arsenite/antimonite-responsive transcriptional repressor
MPSSRLWRMVAISVLARDQKRTARLFHALADETRLRIVSQLADGERCVCDLTGALEAGQSRLSFHLKTLKEVGLLIDRRDGRWIYYSLNRGVLEEVRAFVGELGLPQGRGFVSRRCD